jgi:acyl-CoA synthetase (AMP-forming)/AMP-acid ligase II
MDLVALLEQHRPDRPAVATASTSLTYAELLTAARKHTPCRALVARDAIETAVALVAAVMADDTLVVIDPAAPEPEVARTLDRFDRDGLPSGLGLSTSGVTGEPRSVVRPWAAVAANAAAFADGLGLTPDDVVLTTSAMHHSYAVSAGLCGALAAGASFVAPGGLASPAVLAGHIDNHRATVLLSVPMLYRWYTAGVPSAHPPRLCVSAGAGIGADLRAAWDKNVGWPLVEHYGTSELGQLTVATPDDGGTVGGPLGGIRVRATRPTDTGDHELEVMAAGQPAVLLDDPRRQLTGWVATGDTGVVDDEGRVTITGRLGDTVNVGGKKVALREVEDVLRALPGVRDAAVVTYGDDPTVPKLCGFVESDGEFDESAVLAAVRERLAPHKVPRRVVRLPGLPKTGSGKVRRRDLRLLVTPETVDVPFAGPGAGLSPLTWGGRAIRRSIDWLGAEAHYFNDRHVLPLPDGIALDTVTGGLAALVSRHQAMRAYYPTVDGDVVLRVAGEGTVAVAVYSLPQGDAREFAERVARESGRALFGEDELPLRCAVVRSAGVPRFLVLVLSHQSIDAWTVDILLDELRRLWAGESLSEHPWQLLDQAADEATGDSRRRGEAALRHWQAFYSTADAAMFDLPAQPPEPKPIRSVIMTSPATELASRLVAARLGVSTSVALTGIVAAVLGHLTSHERVTLLLISANRFDRRRRGLVAPLVQDVLCLVELAGDLDAVIRDTARRTLMAHTNACYDPAAESRVRREAELARGVCFDFHAAIVNDVRLRGAGDGPAGTDPAALLPATAFEDGSSWDRQNTKFFVRIIRSPDTCRIELMADTRYVPLADLRPVLGAIESVAMAAADGPVSVAALCPTPLPRGGSWVRCAAGWVDTVALAQLVRRRPWCAAARVALVDGELTAYVRTDESPDFVREAVVAALRGSTVAVAPERYVVAPC